MVRIMGLISVPPCIAKISQDSPLDDDLHTGIYLLMMHWASTHTVLVSMRSADVKSRVCMHASDTLVAAVLC